MYSTIVLTHTSRLHLTPTLNHHLLDLTSWISPAVDYLYAYATPFSLEHGQPPPLPLHTNANESLMRRAVRKSRIHDRRDYRDFRRVPRFLAIAVISCHGREY